MLTDYKALELGNRLVELFELKQDKKTGYYKTAYGNKTAIGVARCVERIMKDANETMVDLLGE